MKHLFIISTVCCLLSNWMSAQSELFIAPGGSIYTSGSSILTLHNTRLTNNGAITANGGTVRITGNVGSLQSSINGSGTTSLQNLTIDKTANGTHLNTSIGISGNLSLNSGSFELVNGNVNFGTTGSLQNETEINRVFGIGGELVAIVNLNAPNAVNHANLGVAISSAQNMGVTTLSRGHLPFMPSGNSTLRYFDIAPTNNSGLNATMRFHYFNAELNGNDENSMVLWRSTNGGLTWANQNGSYSRDVMANWVQVSGISAFSRWTLADCPPPIIQCVNRTVTLNGQPSIMLNANDLVTVIDACGIASIELSPNVITCEQVGQLVPVIVTVRDVNNNVSTCTANITVTGLPCGWSQNPDGVGCTNGNSIAFNTLTGVWTATSTNCYYASPFTADETAFAQRRLCGNGSITARVTSISGALGWAGIVMREGNAAGAKKAQLMTNLSSFSRREFRTTTNGQAFPQQFLSNQRYWLRIVRAGNQFSMYVSPNGTAWYFVGAQNIAMPPCIEMGLVVTNYQQTSTVTATFSGVSFTGSNPTSEANINEFAESIEVPHGFEVYPNPTGGKLNIDLTQYFGRSVRIETYSLEGKLVQFSELDEVQTTMERLDLTGLQSGMYFVKVKSDGLPDATWRVVLQRE